MIKVTVVDDHEIIRDGLKAVLKGAENIEIVSEATNGQEMLSEVRKQKPDVLITDINMPVMNGIEATLKIAEEFPDIKVLALTMYDDDEYIIRMIDAGAAGYILKNAKKEELVMAIQKVYEGGSYFSSEISSKILNRELSKENLKEESAVELTKREIEILKLIAEELKNHEIAERLFISSRTVDTHRRNLLQKLEAKNTAGLVKHAVKMGLI